jgi:hypothetical protein
MELAGGKTMLALEIVNEMLGTLKSCSIRSSQRISGKRKLSE